MLWHAIKCGYVNCTSYSVHTATSSRIMKSEKSIPGRVREIGGIILGFEEHAGSMRVGDAHIFCPYLRYWWSCCGILAEEIDDVARL